MRSSLHFISLLVLIFISLNIHAQQDWQILLSEDLDDLHGGSRPLRVEYEGNSFFPVTYYEGADHYGPISIGFQPAASSSFLLTEMPSIGFRVTLDPAYEYKMSADVETLLGHEVGFFIDGGSGDNILINGPISTQELGEGADPEITSDVFQVTETTEYYVYIKPTASQLFYENLGSWGASYDLFDHFKLERRLLSLPTEVSFVESSQSVSEGTVANICLQVQGPHATEETIIEIDLDGNNTPHFEDFERLDIVFPVGSTAPQCFELNIPQTDPQSNSFFYDFNLFIGANNHAVEIGDLSQFTLHITQSNLLYLTNGNDLEVNEGQSIEICVNSSQVSPSYSNVNLVTTSNYQPHFNNNNSISFAIPPGQTQVCQAITIPTTNNSQSQQYSFELQQVSGYNVAIGLPNQLNILVHPSDVEECWEETLQQDFTTANVYNFSDLSDVVNNGYRKSTYGSSGSSNDQCARATSLSSTYYIGVKTNLQAGVEYRLKWNAKTTTYNKTIDLYLGTTVGNAVLTDGPFPITTQSLNSAGQENESNVFTVPTNGEYVIYLKRASNSPTGGYTKIDDFRLEYNCNVPPIELSFAQAEFTGSEGDQIEVCVGISQAHPSQETSVDIVFDGNSSPHFTSNTIYTVVFPAGDNSDQCILLPTTANGNLDGNMSYTLLLDNPISGGEVNIGSPATVDLNVVDDTSPSDCEIWTTTYSDELDNYAYFLLPNHYETNNTTNLTTEQADFTGDQCVGGTHSTSFYVGFTTELEANYEYRLKWEAKATDKKGALITDVNGVTNLMAVHFGNDITNAPLIDDHPETEGSINIFQSSAITVNTTGTYAFVIRGSGYSYLTRLLLDDFVIEKKCLTTGVAFDLPAQGFYSVEEGSSVEVCLNIDKPAANQSTEVILQFEGGDFPHFEGNSDLTVVFPAGSNDQQCIQIPSIVFAGNDNISEYLLEIASVNGGIHAEADDPTTAIIKIEDESSCWVIGESENFSGINSSISNLPGFYDNNNAVRSYYGGSGTYFDKCAKMDLRSGKHIGFRQYLEAGKSYRQSWEIKAETISKEVFFCIGTSTSFTTEIGQRFDVAVLPNNEASPRHTSEYFTVPVDGYYYLLLKSDDTDYGYLKFDDFLLEERCPPTSVLFTTTDISTEEGYPAEVCIAISNPSPTEETSVEVAFIGNQTPHFGNSSPQLITFPANSSDTICISIPSISDGLVNDIDQYQIVLRDPTGAHFPVLGHPDTLNIHLVDDINLDLCEWAGPDVEICLGDTVQLGNDSLAYVECYNDKYCFSWGDDGSFVDNSQYDLQPFVAPVTDTWYVVYMTDGEGNLFSDTVLVSVNTGPEYNIASTEDYLCLGDEATLSIDAQFTPENHIFEWSTGDTGTSTVIFEGGGHNLTITDTDSQCQSTAGIYIRKPNWDQYELNAKSDFICNDYSTVSLTVDNYSPSHNLDFLWSTSDTLSEINVSAGGVYSVTLTNSSGCDTTLTYIIQNVEEELNLVLQTSTGAICPGNTVVIDAIIEGLILVDSEDIWYVWSTDEGGESIEINQPGTYNVKVYLGEYCVLTQEVVITDDQFGFEIISTNGNDFACPESPLNLSTSTSLGQINQWEWSTGATSNQTNATSTDTYMVTVTNSNGCEYTQSYTPEACPTLISFTATEATVAAGDSIEICLELVNPNENSAGVDVNFVGDQNPHFDVAPTTINVSFAAGETYKCIMLNPRSVEDAAPEVFYQLQLSNATGGNEASLRDPMELSLKVENQIRCVVFQDSTAVNCELTDTSTIVSDVPLINVLKEDDSFWAGDFEVEVIQATGNGVFNGNGVIRVPFFEQVQINVSLKNVKINELCQMVEGEVVVEGVGAKLLSDEILDAINDVLETLDEIDDALEVVQEVLTVIESAVNASEEMGNVLSEDWNILQGSGPIQDEYPNLPDSLLNQIDEAILCFVVNPPDQCSEELAQTINELITAINALFEADYAVQFDPYSDQRYGFDKEQYDIMAADYNRLTVAGEDYKVGWKSVEVGKTDSVLIDLPFADLPNDLSFEENNQNPVSYSDHQGHTILPVTGRGHEETYQIYPVQTKLDSTGNPVKKYAGKLNVISYDEKEIDVVLVPVNGSTVITEGQRSIIENELNEIYDPAVVKINVELNTSDLYVPSLNDEIAIDSSGSAFYSIFNPEMKRIIRAAKELPDYQDDKYYILLVNSFVGNEIQGYMPKSKNMGFVANLPHSSTTRLARTIAHEIGHGAFLLNHLDDEFGMAPGGTDNLMDHGWGTKLHKYQWDVIHNPSLHIALFDSDEESQSVTVDPSVLIDYINADLTYTFLTPSGKPISIKSEELEEVTFNSGDDIVFVGDPQDNFKLYLFGSLAGFKIKLPSEQIVEYKGCGYIHSNNFEGYYSDFSDTACLGESYKDAKTQPYQVNPTESQPHFDKILIGFPFYSSEKGVFFEVGPIKLDYPVVENTVIINDEIIDLLDVEDPNDMGYDGRGEFVDFNLFIPELNSTRIDGYYLFPPFLDTEEFHDSKEIGNPEHDLNLESIMFLKYWERMAVEYGTPHPKHSPMTPYIYIHAQQISDYPGFFMACGNEGENLSELMSIYSTWESMFNAYRAFPAYDERSIRSVVYNLHRMTLFDRWKESGTSIYKNFYNKYRPEEQDTFFNALQNTSEDVISLIEYLEPWKNSPCAFKSITLGNRIIALDVLLHGGNYSPLLDKSEFLWKKTIPDYLFSPERYGFEFDGNTPFEDTEYLFLHLIRTTPASDIKQVLSYFFGSSYEDPSIYFEALSEINDVVFEEQYMDSEGYTEFINILSNWIMYDLYTDNIPVLEEVNRNNGDYLEENFPNGNIIWLNNLICEDSCIEEEEVHQIGDYHNDNILSSLAMQLEGFNGNITYDNDNNITINSEFDINFHSLHDNDVLSHLESQTISMPHELVPIRFVSDYNLPVPGGLQETNSGDYILVPAIYAEYLVRKMNNANFDAALRSTSNLVVIGASIASLGSSSSLLIATGVIDIGLGVVDETIFAPAQYEFDVSGDSWISQSTQSHWVNTMLAVAGLEIGTLGINFLVRRSVLLNGETSIVRVINMEQFPDYIQVERRLNLDNFAHFQQQMSANIDELVRQKNLALLGNENINVVYDLDHRIAACKLEQGTQFNAGSLDPQSYFNLEEVAEGYNVRIWSSIGDNDVVSLGYSPIGVFDDQTNILHLNQASIVDEVPSGGVLLGEIKRLKITKPIDPTSIGVTPRSSLYFTDDGVKILIHEFIPIQTGDEFPLWTPFILLQEWESVLNHHFFNEASFGQLVRQGALADETIYGLQDIMTPWLNEAKINAFANLGEELSQFYLQDLNRVRAWSRLYEEGDILETELIVRFNDRMNSNPALAEFINNTENLNAIPTWKAINRFHVNNPTSIDLDIADYLEELVLSNSVFAEIAEDGTVMLKINMEGGIVDDVAHFSSNGAMNYNQGLLEDPLIIDYSTQHIFHISQNGHVAMVIKNNQCKLIRNACFPANTPIHTAEGTKPIQDIEAGDIVIAYDEIQKDTILATVKQTFSKSWQKMIRLVVGGDTITATNNHPFYLPQLSRYMPADSLRRGMQVLALAGTLMTVQSAMAFDSNMTVYNFEVEEQHNYFVGDEGVLVHNDCRLVKTGLKNLPNEEPFDILQDVIGPYTSATGGTPQAVLGSMEFIQDLTVRGSLLERVRLERFFKASDVLDINPNIPIEELLGIKRNRVSAWDGLFPSETLRKNIDALTEGDYLLGKGFTKSDLNGYASYVDNAFSGTKSTLTSRINSSSGFNLIHTDDQIQAIMLRAKSLDLSPKEIDDLLFTSCRLDNQIPAANLMQQMDNWVNVVKDIGYPYLFSSVSEYDQFGAVLKNLADDFNIPDNKFNMQGSSLRNSNVGEIGDLDIAYRVDEATFNNLVTQFTDAAANPTTVQNIISDSQNGIVRGYNMFIDTQTNGSFKGRFFTEFENVFGSGYQTYFNKPSNFDIQITIIKDGAPLDVSPYLQFN